MLKKQTIKTIIKYITLFIVLMLPLLATLPTTLYYGMNEHAIDGQYQEYSVQYEYETNEVNSASDLVVGNIYKVQLDCSELTSTTDLFNTNGVFYLQANTAYFINVKSTTDYYLRFRYAYSSAVIQLYIDDGHWVDVTDDDFILDFYCLYYNSTCSQLTWSESDYLGNASLIKETTTTNASNAFERASKDIFNSTMFSWVEDSPLTTNIVGMISFFGIVEGTLMNNLITYWISVIAIFMIINIVLLIFDRLTHIINKDTE